MGGQERSVLPAWNFPKWMGQESGQNVFGVVS